MAILTETLQSFDSTRLEATYRPAKGVPNGLTLLWVHGAFEHQRRYVPVMEHFAGLGYGSVAFDQRGHGNSGGGAMVLRSFEDYLQDLKAVYFHFDERLPGPVALVGHSMGALVATRFRQEFPTAMPRLVCTLLSSPFFGVAVKVPAWKTTLSKLVVNILPKIAVPTGLEAKFISHDPKIVRAYEQDKHVHKKTTAGWYENVLKANMLALAEAPRMPGPLHILAAGDDHVVSLSETKRFFDALPQNIEKSFQLVPGAYHEIFNEAEPRRSQALALAEGVLARHI